MQWCCGQTGIESLSEPQNQHVKISGSSVLPSLRIGDIALESGDYRYGVVYASGKLGGWPTFLVSLDFRL
jgi:hypothetical protein